MAVLKHMTDKPRSYQRENLSESSTGHLDETKTVQVKELLFDVAIFFFL